MTEDSNDDYGWVMCDDGRVRWKPNASSFMRPAPDDKRGLIVLDVQLKAMQQEIDSLSGHVRRLETSNQELGLENHMLKIKAGRVVFEYDDMRCAESEATENAVKDLKEFLGEIVTEVQGWD